MEANKLLSFQLQGTECHLLTPLDVKPACGAQIYNKLNDPYARNKNKSILVFCKNIGLGQRYNETEKNPCLGSIKFQVSATEPHKTKERHVSEIP